MKPFDSTLLAVGLVAALAATAVTVYVAGHPLISEDATIERAVQATGWGPLALTFPVYSWIGDAHGAIVEAAIFAVVLIVNRRAWLVPAAAAVSAGWYEGLSHVVIRPRPTTAQVLRVTEHPAASSFPSGHTIFIITVVVVLMVCLGYLVLHGWQRVMGWVIGGLIVCGNVIDRIYSGAHWPSDVLAGILIAVAWLSIVLSVRAISRPLLSASGQGRGPTVRR